MAYDIAIIGAGPAGATLARLLSKQYRILLLDRRDLLDGDNETREKCCGGLLAPDAQKILGRLGLAVPTGVLVDPQLFLVRTIDFDNQIERFYQRFYFNMDRKRFDEWLVSIIPDHVDLALGCRFNSLSDAKEGYQIAFMHENKIYTEKVGLVIGADGAWSNVRRQLLQDNDPVRRYIAIQEWFETDESIPHYGAIFDSSVTDFYSWIITKDNQLIIGSALQPEKQADQRFELLKRNLRDYGYRIGGRIKRSGAYVVRPRSNRDLYTGNDHSALVGEAAGFISPSSAEGISYAIQSAYALAKSLDNGMEGFQKRYEANLGSLKRNLIIKRLKSPGMYNRTLRGLVMRSGILSSKLL